MNKTIAVIREDAVPFQTQMEHLHSFGHKILDFDSEHSFYLFVDKTPRTNPQYPDLIIAYTYVKWSDANPDMPIPNHNIQSEGPMLSGIRSFMYLNQHANAQGIITPGIIPIYSDGRNAHTAIPAYLQKLETTKMLDTQLYLLNLERSNLEKDLHAVKQILEGKNPNTELCDLVINYSKMRL